MRLSALTVNAVARAFGVDMLDVFTGRKPRSLERKIEKMKKIVLDKEIAV